MNAASRFLRVMAGDGPVTFQTFSDRDDLKVKRPDGKTTDPNARILHGTLTQHGDLLTRLNTRGAGVYVMVNAGDGKHRAARNVQRVRALFIDTDGAPYPSELPLKPHLTTQSSPGRWHLYWLVDGVTLESFSTLQAALAEHYGTDPSVKDLPRVMRLPGFYHRKSEPVMVELLQANDAPLYAPEEILTAWPFLVDKLEHHRTETAEKEKRRAENLAAAKERRALPKVDDDPDRRRALAILDGHFNRVSTARDGTKHDTLVSSARALGGYVAGGYLEAGEVADKLKEAATIGNYSESNSAAAITWGLAKGAEEPLKLEETAHLPDRKQNDHAEAFKARTQAEALHLQRTAPTEGSSAYLKRKDVAELFTTHRVAPAKLASGETVPGLVYSADDTGPFFQLVLRDLEGTVSGFQRIYDGERGKRFVFGSKPGGAFVLLEPVDRPLPKTARALNDLELAICERFATGATVCMARPRTAMFCALTEGNLAPVAEALRGRYGYTQRFRSAHGKTARRAVDVTIWGDLDASGTGEQAAHRAALESGCYVRLPKFRKGYGDFNDLHAARGLEAVRRTRKVTPDAALAFAKELGKQKLSPEKHLATIALPDSGGALIVRAPQETGKTHRLAELLSGCGLRVLVVTHRESLAKNLAARLRFECYQDYPAYMLRDIPRLVICFDSLQKLAIGGALPSYDVLVLDESEQVLQHTTGRHIKRKLQNFAALEHYLKTAPRIICADADAGHLTADTLKRFNPERVITWQRHDHHIGAGRRLRFTHDRDDVLDALETETRPTWYATDSLRHSRDLDAYLDDPDTLTINSETATTDAALAYLSDPTGQASKHRRMIASPSVQTGLSDDSGHWQHVGGSFTGHTSTPQDAMQALMRARGVGELTVYAARGRGVAVSVQDALEGAAAVGDFEGAALGQDYGDPNPNYERLRAEVEAQRSRRQAGYKKQLVLKAAKLGYDITYDVARDIGPKDLQRRDDRRAALKAAGLERYVRDRVDAERIDAARAEQLDDKYTRSQTEHFALEQYQCRAFYALLDDLGDDDLGEMLRADDYKSLRDKVMRYENLIEPRTVAEARARGDLDAGVLRGDAKGYMLRHEYGRQLGRVVGLDAETEAHAETWQGETERLEVELRTLKAEADNAQTRRKGELLRQVRRLETDLEARRLAPVGTTYRADSATVRAFVAWCSKNHRALKHAGLVTATLDNLKAKPLETIGDSLRRAGLGQRHDGKRGAAKSYALTIVSVSGMCNYSRPRRKNWTFAQQTNIKALDNNLLCKTAVLASQTGLITPPQKPEHDLPALHGPDDLQNWLEAGRLDAYGPEKLHIIWQKVADQDARWLHRLANSRDTGRMLGAVR